ncbi:MAG: T9SS type A sorting domain-containing protein [Bacteroidales bacterium]
MNAPILRFIIIFSLGFGNFFPAEAQPSVYTFFGTGQAGYVNGNQSIAQFNHPFGLSYGYLGRIFISDADNHCIRVINPFFETETYAGTGISGYLDGPAYQARFNSPSDIWADPVSDVVYVCDFQNQRIRKIENGIVSTIAGSGQAGYLDGPADSARFNYPRGICRDNLGNLYIGDSWNHRIRKISPDGIVSTYAGGGSAIGVGSVGDLVDGTGSDARFYTPAGLTIDLEGNIYIADAYNHRIRKIDSLQQVTTFAGSGPTGPGQGGFNNGPPLTARFHTPTAIKYFETFCPGNAPAFFIADTYNNKIRMMREDLGPWNVISYAGSGIAGFQNGPADSATFNFPRAITGAYGDATCHLLVADYNNHSIRAIQDFYTLIPDPVTAPEISLWPNPAENIVSLSLKNHSIQNQFLVISDITGKVLKTARIITNPQKVDISSLSRGIYFISLFSGCRAGGVVKLIKH